MKNHYHFVIRLGELGMASGMQQLNGGYAIAFNQHYAAATTSSAAVTGAASSTDEADLLETAATSSSIRSGRS